ncbi:ATP-binding protein [Thermoleophilia bacterium SCSIO 60948]|nr:ATP-binding protein [Thermoleophilia bacterium SCSIO 60948]
MALTPNPFRFGALALDEDFTDRDLELAELTSDTMSGQDVVISAPRRFGKSSLIWRLSQELVGRGAAVAYVDLMTTPTRERFAAKLAKAIHDELADPAARAREAIGSLFSDLRVSPAITFDPNTGGVGFSFDVGRSPADVDATIERLLELPAQIGAERGIQVVLVLDEFQEVTAIDPGLPRLMRAVFQTQPEVSHVYLGSSRHLIEQIFNDENEPFWRSAKRLALGPIAAADFNRFIAAKFAATDRAIETDVLERVLATTGGHPYATQELCYFLWEQTGPGTTAGNEELEAALGRLLASEEAHFSLLFDRLSRAQRVLALALAREAGRPLTEEYRRRHGLGPASSVQRAISSLLRDEVITYERGAAAIAEPFLAEWLLRLDGWSRTHPSYAAALRATA